MVAFRRYLETGDVQLVSSNFCKYDRICVACATKRAMRMIKKFKDGVQKHQLYEKKRYYIVLTIRHKQSDTLEELMDRLMLYKDKLARSYRNSTRESQKSKSFFSNFDGMVVSIEISHKGTSWWHPHINILACSDKDIKIDTQKHYTWDVNEELQAEWFEITNRTSFIHNIRKIDVKKNHFTRTGIGEVFKYAIKFSDLSVEQLWEIMVAQHKHQYRFFATYGIFRGWERWEWFKYSWDWSEGVFLFKEDTLNYQKTTTVTNHWESNHLHSIQKQEAFILFENLS